MADSRGETTGLAQTSARVALWAGLALVSGFAVDATIAALFGIGISTDAFFIAATVPFALTAVLAASANQALVPQFNTWHEQESAGDAGARSGGMIGALLVMATGVAVLGVALAAVLPDILASGASTETRDLATSLIALLFVMLVPRAAAESLRALLNSRFSFSVPAASPLILNGVALATAFALSDRLGIRAVAVGYLLGSFAQVALLALVTWRRGIPFRLGFGFNDPEVRSGLKLLALPTAATGMNLFARIFERFLASFLASGSITIVSYAWRILNAVGGTVFFRSVTVVLIPRLTKFRDDPNATKRILGAGVRVMLAISFPLMGFLVVFAAPAVGVLFERGEFSGDDTIALGSVLAIYMLTLPFVGVTRALLTYFYSRLDMVTPFFNRLINTLTNMAFAAILVVPFGLKGLAFAYVLATAGSFVHAFLATKRLNIFNRRMVGFILRVAVASVASVASAAFVYWLLPEAESTLGRIAALGVAGVVWLAVAGTIFGATSVDLRMSIINRPIDEHEPWFATWVKMSTDSAIGCYILRRRPVLPSDGDISTMSILEWAQGLGWRLAILVAIPLVAGFAAFFAVAGDPPDYRAVATVNAPAPPSANPTPQVANQAVANLQSLVSSKAFADVISDDTGVPASKVRSSLVSSRVGAGTLVEIISTSRDGSEAVAVVIAAGHRSVGLVLSTDLMAAQAAVDLALASFDRANDAVSAAVDSHGADPSVQLDLARDVLVQSQAARARAVAGGATSTELRKLDNEIEDLEAEVAALVPIADEFELLTRAREAAGVQVATTTSELQAVEAVIAAADASVVDPTDASEVSNRVPVARKVATVVVLAGTLALILVLLLGLIWPRGGETSKKLAPDVRSSDDI